MINIYSLKVFTLNCWGVNIWPFDASEYRIERMKAIADHIVHSGYDLVFLQVNIPSIMILIVHFFIEYCIY